MSPGVCVCAYCRGLLLGATGDEGMGAHAGQGLGGLVSDARVCARHQRHFPAKIHHRVGERGAHGTFDVFATLHNLELSLKTKLQECECSSYLLPRLLFAHAFYCITPIDHDGGKIHFLSSVFQIQ